MSIFRRIFGKNRRAPQTEEPSSVLGGGAHTQEIEALKNEIERLKVLAGPAVALAEREREVERREALLADRIAKFLDDQATFLDAVNKGFIGMIQVYMPQRYGPNWRGDDLASLDDRGDEEPAPPAPLKATTPRKDPAISPVGERIMWSRRNYGVLNRIAKEIGVTGAAVGQVLSGRRNSKRIAAALAKAGAPGFEGRS